MESMVVRKVSSEWTNVKLSEIYSSPIAVCTVHYENSPTALLATVVRMQILSSTSIQIRLHNPDGNNVFKADEGHDVHCVVVDEGQGKMRDGRKIEAQKYESRVTDSSAGSWVGEKRTYKNSYAKPPIVLGQVMSSNDKHWSVFWSRGSNPQLPPNANDLFTGKHVGKDGSEAERAVETVGYIVIEAGHKISSRIEIETGHGVTKPSSKYKFNKKWKKKAKVAVVSQVGMIGLHGSWAVSGGIKNKRFMNVAIERNRDEREIEHESESFDYMVFSKPGYIGYLVPPRPTPTPSALPSSSPSSSPSCSPSFEEPPHDVCGNFAVHAGTAVAFDGVQTTIKGGNVGVSPGTSIQGGYTIDGGVVENDSSGFAESVLVAHDEAMALHCNEKTMASEIGGMTFTPGTYRSASSINVVVGTFVTLDGLDEPNPVFLFIAVSTLVTAENTKFILKNGAKAENILWVLGSSATLGANSIVEGSIMAKKSITFGEKSTLNGCALAIAAVTFESEGMVDVEADSPESARYLRGY
jgi:hypothetical protein